MATMLGTSSFRAIANGSPSAEAVCLRCLLRLSRQTLRPARQTPFSTSSRLRGAIASSAPPNSLFRKEYFSGNELLSASRKVASRGAYRNTSSRSSSAAEASIGGQGRKDNETVAAQAETSVQGELSHRRRKRLREEALAAARAENSATSADNPAIPLDASSQLSSLSSSLPANSLRRRLTTYLSLSKPRLTFLIVLTTTTAYSLYPVPDVLLPSATSSPSLSPLTLLFLTTGTTLSSACANALNMLFEPSYDAKMSRTRNRPLVRKLISPRGALLFAVFIGAAGLGALYYGVNPTVCFLGALNIFLYAGCYTPLKRITVANTWVGAIVGGIPPLMGWAAAAGQSASGAGDWKELLFGPNSAGGWLVAALLFAWQFPHFNALSWAIRNEYKDAGYRMLCWVNPARNGRVALRYALAMFPICIGLSVVGVTDWGFIFTSSLVNGWMVREAWRFWKNEGKAGTARGLFWASVWHLPVVMVLAMVQKKGLWQRIWRSIFGEPEELYEDEMEDEVDEQEMVLKGEGQRNGVKLPV